MKCWFPHVNMTLLSGSQEQCINCYAILSMNTTKNPNNLRSAAPSLGPDVSSICCNKKCMGL